MIAARNTIDAHAQDFAMNDQLLCGGADRSLARPTSRYHMTESIVSLDGQPSDFFFFFSGLLNLEQRAKKCIELRGEYVE